MDAFNKLISSLLSELPIEPRPPNQINNNNDAEKVKRFISDKFYGDTKRLLLSTFSESNSIDNMITTLRNLLLKDAKTDYDVYTFILQDPELLATFIKYMPNFPFDIPLSSDNTISTEEIKSAFVSSKPMTDDAAKALRDISTCLANNVDDLNRREIFNLTLAIKEASGRTDDVVSYERLQSRNNFIFAYQDQILRTIYAYAITLSGVIVTFDDILKSAIDNPYLKAVNMKEEFNMCTEHYYDEAEDIISKNKPKFISMAPPLCSAALVSAPLTSNFSSSTSTLPLTLLPPPLPLKMPIFPFTQSLGKAAIGKK